MRSGVLLGSRVVDWACIQRSSIVLACVLRVSRALETLPRRRQERAVRYLHRARNSFMAYYLMEIGWMEQSSIACRPEAYNQLLQWRSSRETWRLAQIHTTFHRANFGFPRCFLPFSRYFCGEAAVVSLLLALPEAQRGSQHVTFAPLVECLMALLLGCYDLSAACRAACAVIAFLCHRPRGIRVCTSAARGHDAPARKGRLRGIEAA
ncbi:hypothetical protein BJ546DRAFT_104667 [Cryomyces antarcticus]